MELTDTLATSRTATQVIPCEKPGVCSSYFFGYKILIFLFLGSSGKFLENESHFSQNSRQNCNLGVFRGLKSKFGYFLGFSKKFPTSIPITSTLRVPPPGAKNMNDLETQKASFETESTSEVGPESLPDSRSETSRKGVNIFPVSAYQEKVRITNHNNDSNDNPVCKR